MGATGGHWWLWSSWKLLMWGSWLSFIDALSFIKLAISITKYCPQACPLPRSRFEQTADHANRGRLAGSVRPEKAPDFAGRHPDINAIDRNLVAEALGQPGDVRAAVHTAPPVHG